MNISNIVETVSNTLDSANIPANILPPLLLKCTALNKPGLSAYKIATQIIENNKALGIPTEDNPDGSPNQNNQQIYNIVKCIVDALHDDASIQISIPMSSLLIQVSGGNAGGPFVAHGTNLTDSISNGIIV